MKTKSFKMSLGFAVFLIIVGCVLIYIGSFVDDDAIKTSNVSKGEYIDYAQVRPPTTIVFEHEGEEIGRLEWGSGKFHFIGEADQSAKVFLDYFLKPYVDQYIEDELRRRKDE